MPFVPPAKAYTPLEKIVERVPNWGYHLFFADKASSGVIEKNVSPLRRHSRRGCFLTAMHEYQLDTFNKLIWRDKKTSDEKLSNWTLTGGLPKLLNNANFKLASTGLLNQQVRTSYTGIEPARY